ncbi:hypothetical protein Tco_0798184 [Tanacetum coccineum]
MLGVRVCVLRHLFVPIPPPELRGEPLSDLSTNGGFFSFGLTKLSSRQQKFLVLRFFDVKEQQGIDRIHNEKLVQTLLKGHSILLLEGSLSGDCDVEKNGKWSCIYAVGSQEYQMVCTRLDIASADVGMLDKFDRGLQTDVQVFVDFDYAMAAYMTLTEAAKEVIWLKSLAIESGFELKIVASIATGALSKAIPIG